MDPAFIVTLVGAVIALVAAFVFHSTSWIVVGVVIAIVGIAFRSRGGRV